MLPHVEEYRKELVRVLNFGKISDIHEREASQLYAYVEQKVRNQLVRDFHKDYHCPICGSEKKER